MHKYSKLAPETLDWILSHGDASALCWYLMRNRLATFNFVTI